MKQIEVQVLNPSVALDAEKLMVTMARLTQRGHTIHNMNDFNELHNKDYSENLVDSMVNLPHPTIQKFGVLNIVIVGASRRFLAQITRHQNEVKFMSASLQYSLYSKQARFTVPYELTSFDIENPEEPSLVDMYLRDCQKSMRTYEYLAAKGGNDAAGYATPNGLRNTLLISATPYQLKHMIRQRTCNRNTPETQYVMLLLWEELRKLSNLFKDCGPFCMYGSCPEGKMSCKDPIVKNHKPIHILDERFKHIREVF